MTWCTEFEEHWRDALFFFKVIRPISRSRRQKIANLASILAFKVTRSLAVISTLRFGLFTNITPSEKLENTFPIYTGQILQGQHYIGTSQNGLKCGVVCQRHDWTSCWTNGRYAGELMSWRAGDFTEIERHAKFQVKFMIVINETSTALWSALPRPIIFNVIFSSLIRNIDGNKLLNKYKVCVCTRCINEWIKSCPIEVLDILKAA